MCEEIWSSVRGEDARSGAVAISMKHCRLSIRGSGNEAAVLTERRGEEHGQVSRLPPMTAKQELSELLVVLLIIPYIPLEAL